MADGRYRTSLTGLEVDDALRQLNERVAEGWAEGTRDGNEVGNDSPYYHNNAKYYAELAKSATPTPYTAAVRWDADMNLADSDKARARANISAGASNRNLLDNPFFTVNQRDFTSVTGTNGVYTVDRWKINNGGGTGGTVEVTGEGYIKIVTGSAYTSYQQAFGSNELAGKTVTLTVNDSGLLYSVSAVIPARTTSTQTPIDFVYATGKRVRLYVQPTSAAAGYMVQFSISSGGVTAVLRAVKLELGSYSTLANDVPPKLREARADCQERFLRVKSDTTVGVIGFGSQTQSDRAYILIPTPVTMELNANNTMSVSLSGTARLVGNGSGSITVTSVSFVSREANGVLIACFGSNIVANVTYNLYLTSGSYIDLSADL